MSKSALLGVLCLVGGCLILLFQAIASVMGTEVIWENLTLMDTFPPEIIDEIDNMSEGTILNSINYITTLPLYILLFCVGGVLLVISSFLWRR